MTTKIAVLDDNTIDANEIGLAASPNEAADVFMAYMKERMDPADFADLKRPQFTRRAAGRTDGPRDLREQDVFEPLF